MTTIIISLAGGWVLKHRDDDVLPVEFLKTRIQEKYCENVIIVDSGLTELIVQLNEEHADNEFYIQEIRNIFAEHYGLENENEIISFKVSSGEQNQSSAKEDIKTDSDDTNSTEKCMEQINALIGGEEFKALAHELVQIAPQIIQNKTFDTFSYQSYVFSINDGYGLSTYLSLLSKLLATLKIKPLISSDNVIEKKLLPPRGDSTEPFLDVERILKHGKKDSLKVLCIDISEWMNETNTRLFKEFLINVERHMSEFIVVFRVPFVDKEILERVKYSLNDLMFVRTISFPPFTQKEIQQCATAEFNRYGFKMSQPAWEYFHERIAEEKSDGKFYGLNTIKKVVRELLYKKQLSNAQRGKTDLCISKRDATAICAHSQNIGLSGYEMLDRLVGGAALKQRINEIVSQIELAKNDDSLQAPCIHMRFVGNPGTGKTTVARIVGKILKEKGVLRIGNFYEYSGRDFCGRYIGETAPKTASMCRDAYGSVLFIDEAYSLYRGDGNDRDYGREALDTLIAEMENHRSDFVVIMAGYTDDMNKLMEGNAGLASRMPYVIEFPNFNREQLYNIFVSMLNRQFKYEEDMLELVKTYFDNIPEDVITAKEFSNARFVRNLFERTWAKAAMRCQLEKIGTITLTKDDFERSTSDKEFTFIMKKKKNKIGFVG